MARKRQSPEEIIRILRKFEVETGNGISIEDCCRKAGISDVTYHRWNREYGGMRVDQAKKLKVIGKLD